MLPIITKLSKLSRTLQMFSKFYLHFGHFDRQWRNRICQVDRLEDNNCNRFINKLNFGRREIKLVYFCVNFATITIVVQIQAVVFLHLCVFERYEK